MNNYSPNGVLKIEEETYNFHCETYIKNKTSFPCNSFPRKLVVGKNHIQL